MRSEGDAFSVCVVYTADEAIYEAWHAKEVIHRARAPRDDEKAREVARRECLGACDAVPVGL